jgi:hypothetical protein
MRDSALRRLLSLAAALAGVFCLVETCTAEVVLHGTDARFVRVTNNGSVNRLLHIGEIEAFLSAAPPVTSGVDNTNDVALDTKGAIYYSSVGTGGHGATSAVYDGALQTGANTWTRGAVGAEYVLDLGQTRDLAAVRIWQRADSCCQDRLSDFTVSLLADNGGAPGTEVYSESFPGVAATNSFALFDTSTEREILPGGSGAVGVEILGAPGGRFIRVRNNNPPRTLHIGEIEAFLASAPPSGTGLDNVNDVALDSKGATFESEAGTGGHGSTSAVYNGVVDSGAATWNRDNAGEYVLDLGQNRDLSIIRVWQRGDACCDIRLSDFTLSLLNDDGSGLPGDELYSVSFPGTGTRPYTEFTIPHFDTTFTILDKDKLGIELDPAAGTADLFSVGDDGLGGLTINPGATLDVSLLSVVRSGDFNILDFGSVTGTFSTINLQPLPTGFTWNTSELYTTGILSIVPEPSTLAMLLGLAGLGLLGSLRRRRG